MTTANLPTDYVLAWMRAHKVPLTKENYLHINYMGQEIPEGAEEYDIPREIVAAEKRAVRRADKRLLRQMGIKK